MGCYMPLLLGYRKSLYPYNPAYGGAVSDTDPIHKGMNQIHTPTQKSVSIDTSGKGVNLTDCTDLCNRLKIELEIECISITPPCPVCLIALSQNCDARRFPAGSIRFWMHPPLRMSPLLGMLCFKAPSQIPQM